MVPAHNNALATLVARIDRQIAQAEKMMLEPTSDQELNLLLGQPAELQTNRRNVEATLKASEQTEHNS